MRHQSEFSFDMGWILIKGGNAGARWDTLASYTGDFGNTCSNQSVTAFSRFGTNLQGRHWACRRREINPAASSTFKCEEIVGCVNEKRPTSSDTDASPRARCTTIPRRVGSARAAKAWSSCFMCIDYSLYR